ncbi:hypothetical protein NKH18_47620 [Streptomyces sp. M10(2022)]
MSLRDVLERIGPELRFRADERTTLEQARQRILAEGETSPCTPSTPGTGNGWPASRPTARSLD